MADLALVTAGKVEVVESIIQMTLPTAETIGAGNAARQDGTTGKFTKANATTATENRVYGIAVTPSRPGVITCIRKGVLAGFDLSALAYDAPVYLSDTDGTLGTTAGTTSVVVGRVIAASGNLLGQPLDKLLFIDL